MQTRLGYRFNMLIAGTILAVVNLLLVFDFGMTVTIILSIGPMSCL